MTKILKLRKFVQDDGKIVPIEFLKNDLPFVPARIFYIWDVPNGKMRGGHGHKECEQILICLRGNFSVKAVWKDETRDIPFVEEYRTMLDQEFALHVPARTWLELTNFTSDAICLVLASHHYDTKDYIHDLNEIVHPV